MTESNMEQQHQTNISKSPTIGERLRLTRESKKLTIADVASQLMLTKDNIVKLESDQWDKLHGRPYARGYFSSYVNFLGLPHNEMLALFDLEYATDEPSIDGFKRTNKKNGFPFLTFVFLLAIVAAAWFGVRYWQNMEAEVSIIDTIDSSLNEPETSEIIPETVSANIEPVVPETSYQPPVIDNQSQQIDSVVTTVDASVAVVDTEAVAAINQFGNDDTFSSAVNGVTDMTLNAENETSVDVQDELVADNTMLVMNFAEDCWVEVSDGNNKKLLHKMAFSNEVIALTGQWPLQVLLGNAAAVTVTYDNREFDISANTKANIARFFVGEVTE